MALLPACSHACSELGPMCPRRLQRGCQMRSPSLQRSAGSRAVAGSALNMFQARVRPARTCCCTIASSTLGSSSISFACQGVWGSNHALCDAQSVAYMQPRGTALCGNMPATCKHLCGGSLGMQWCCAPLPGEAAATIQQNQPPTSPAQHACGSTI